MKCYVCSNVETLVAGSWLENHPENFSMEGLYRVVREFCSNHEALSDYHYDSIYNHWHGGKFDQFFTRCGFFCAVPNTIDDSNAEIVRQLSHAIQKEIDSQASDEFTEACLYWANELEAGNYEFDRFKKQIAPELVNFVDSLFTVEEMIVELRRVARA